MADFAIWLHCHTIFLCRRIHATTIGWRVFFCVEWNIVQNYLGHYWSIVAAPDDECGAVGGMIGSEKTCPSAALSTTNPIWPGPGLNPGRWEGGTNRLSYGTACGWMQGWPPEKWHIQQDDKLRDMIRGWTLNDKTVQLSAAAIFDKDKDHVWLKGRYVEWWG
jgi:hypothetical protein